MNWHHQRAVTVLAATVVLDLVLGVVFGVLDQIGVVHGLYCATATATTVGCDVTPRGFWAYLVSFVMLLTIVPLFASVFAFFTTGLTADHIDDKTDRQTQQIKEHLSS